MTETPVRSLSQHNLPFSHGNDEKDDSIEKIENLPTRANAGLNESNLPSYHDIETQRILRKVDYRLLPMLTLLYVLAFLDRGNIGNAKVAGMNEDLGLTSAQYNIALTVFFFPYAIFEVPSNIILKLLRPSIWICIMMCSWGLVMTFQGLVKNYHHLVVTRTLLGFTESGFFPAATYLLTTWYCRFEVQTRMAVFFSAASMAGAFSGLLAFAIEKMRGVGGLEGWRWIFILEGIVTVLVGLTLPWTLPDSPAEASFLTTDEKLFIARRLEQDAGTSSGRVKSGEKFQWRFLRAALTEWKIYFAMIAYWGNSVCLYAFTYSAPSIILEMGYTAANAQLLTIPIYVLGVVSTLVFSRMADRRKSRWPFIVGPFSIALLGLIGLLSIPHPRLPGLTYAFLFTIPAGVYPPLIGILAWVSNNLAPSWKRAVGMALLISLGNFGGAIGSNIFIESQRPSYPLGYGFCIAIVAAAIICTLVLRTSWVRVNNKRDAMSDDDICSQYTEDELLDMGDKSPRYRYVV
ncbi:retrograde regulation protein 2 [Corynespora cassiicola Philippines]|uniref:Retrograde regulation protein 2 n=1 Tax=Corynespora cassiicola Philippines TaxID=1448308 RepID=A0A2T2P5I8_CORCC|nr:retrograde regulation protein 2 [Corynespora cassiicola Philippines]